MIGWIRLILTALLMTAGLVVFAIGVFGVYRFKYALNRMHAAAINDTLGVSLCLLGLAISAPDGFAALKMLLVVAFLWISAPVSSHLICRLEVETNDERAQHMEIVKEPLDSGFAPREEGEENA